MNDVRPQTVPRRAEPPDAKERLRLLAALGKEMREAQSAYFESRSRENLDRAKELERGFDAEVARILNPTLF
jgi:hypothetical protein